MIKNLLTLFVFSAAPLLAEISYFPAQPAKITPAELISYKSELMEAMRYRGQREKALQLIKENKNDCVNDEAAHDGFSYSPLVQACQWKDAGLVQALLEQGANPNHPRLEKMMDRLTPEIKRLLTEAHSRMQPPAISAEAWEKRYQERIGGRLFWSPDRKKCVSATESNGQISLWNLQTDARGRLMPVAVFYIKTDGYNLVTVTRHSSLIQATLSKGDTSMQTAMFVHDGFALHDFTVQPVSKNYRPSHPICELPEYSDFVKLTEN